jgi:hypothetical protein
VTACDLNVCYCPLDQTFRRYDVRKVSIASVWPPTHDFRSTPMNRHRCHPTACLKGASFGLMHRNRERFSDSHLSAPGPPVSRLSPTPTRDLAEHGDIRPKKNLIEQTRTTRSATRLTSATSVRRRAGIALDLDQLRFGGAKRQGSGAETVGAVRVTATPEKPFAAVDVVPRTASRIQKIKTARPTQARRSQIEVRVWEGGAEGDGGTGHSIPRGGRYHRQPTSDRACSTSDPRSARSGPRR